MKTMTSILLALLLGAGCADLPEEPARCLDASTLLMDGAAYSCPGPRGCYALPDGAGLACDDSEVRPGAPCPDPGALWCGPGWLYRCRGGSWESFAPCPGGCQTSPLRCSEG